MSKQTITPVYGIHAVKRMMQRHLSIDAIDQIAKVGVIVQENGNRVMKRGDVGNQPIHVVIERPANIVVTVYTANEWESTVSVNRKRPMASTV